MTKPRAKPKSGTSLTININNKGGVGKTLTTAVTLDHAQLSGAAVRVAQLDAQDRLPRLLRGKILTIGGDARTARRDPAADMRAFTPFHSLIEAAVKAGQHAVLDGGAGQLDRLATWCTLSGLAEDLAEWGVDVTILVPLLAEAEAIRLGAATLAALGDALPSARLVVVENERDGAFTALHPLSEGADAYRILWEHWDDRTERVRMPKLLASSWGPFEAAGIRLLALPGMPIEQVMRLTGLPRPEARIARGDVAGWAGELFAELDRVLPWVKAERAL